MGLFGKIFGGIGKVLGFGGGGGGGPVGYQSPHTREYEDNARSALYNRIGARQYKDDKGNLKYDFSGVGNPIEGASGVRKASMGYDFSPINQAIAGYRKPTKLSQMYAPTSYTNGYNPTNYMASNFNFKSLPEQYGKLAYERGAGNIRREAQGNLEKLQETVGPRRLDLLSKLGEDSQRNEQERLAQLDTDVQLKQMEDAEQMAKEEQLQQAAENYRAAGFNDEQARAKADADLGAAQFNAGEGFKGYQSRADLEKANADNAYRYLQGLESAGRGKIATQSGLVEDERSYQDRALEYLTDLFAKTAGLNSQAAQAGAANASSKRGQTLGFLGDLGKTAAAFL